jgi:hypothetical protein
MRSSRALYRARQVAHALRPRIDADELQAALGLLSPAQSRLFLAMQRRDQRHALEVVRRLAPNTQDPDVMIAALLHDCGKGAVPVWLRVLKVASPGLVATLAKPDAAGVRGAAYRLMAHETLSADLAAEAGCSHATVRLISGKPLAEDLDKALLLAAADDAS